MYEAAGSAGLTWPRFERPATFWRRWTVVSYFTGLRLADMMKHFTTECISDDAIVLSAQKTGKTLAVPNCRVLKYHLAHVPPGRVFPVSKSPHLVRRELRKLSNTAESSVKVTPHALRRLAITEWSSASESAGRIVHGCGVSGIMASYLHVLRPLQKARPHLTVPKQFLTTSDENQLTLF